MKFPVDSYDLKARYAPGLLLALPVLLTMWTCFNTEIKEISNFIGALLSATLIYGLSVIVRGMGKRLEPKLKEKWGGFASTIIVTQNDHTIGKELKRQYLEAASAYLKLPIPSLEEEENNPEQAREMIDQLFNRIKGVIRQEEKDGLWSIANAEYGFARNLYGSRTIWLILCVLSTLVSGIFLYVDSGKLVLIGIIFNGLLLASCIIFGWFILPRYTKEVAFRYAEHSWESFYNISQKKPKRDN